MDSDDRGHPHVRDAEDRVGLVGRPQYLAQGRDEQVAAMPDHPVTVLPQPPPVLLGVDHHHPAGADDQVDAPMVVERCSLAIGRTATATQVEFRQLKRTNVPIYPSPSRNRGCDARGREGWRPPVGSLATCLVAVLRMGAAPV